VGVNGQHHTLAALCLILRYYPSMCLEGLRKTAKNLSNNSWSLDRDLNPGPPEVEAGVLISGSRRLLQQCKSPFFCIRFHRSCLMCVCDKNEA
jgi:hypothetical protein